MFQPQPAREHLYKTGTPYEKRHCWRLLATGHLFIIIIVYVILYQMPSYCQSFWLKANNNLKKKLLHHIICYIDQLIWYHIIWYNRSELSMLLDIFDFKFYN